MANSRRLRLTRQAREKFTDIRRLEQIQQLGPIEFEQFVGYLYQQEGYRVSMTATSGDEGVDLDLRRGREHVVVQCKRYAGTVGQATVRDLYGAMHYNRAQAAALVTSGLVSQPAVAWAQDKPIALIDGHELMSWNRRLHSSAAPIANIPWTRIGIVAGAAVILGIVTLALAWSWLTFSNRTASPPQPAPGGDTAPVLPTAPPQVADPTTAPAATVTLSSNTGDQVSAVRFINPPAVDADLGEWDGVAGFASPYVVASADGWDGSRDQDTTWRLGWDERALYLGVTVNDDRHVQMREPKFAYLGDSLELQLDTNLNGDYAARVSPDDFQFILSPGDFEGLAPGAFRFRGNESGGIDDAPGSSATVVARQTGSGYVLEAAIPWSDLNLNGPQPGLTLGAALSSNDNDTPETAVQEVMFSHVPTRRWRDPTSWGTLRLAP